MKMQRESAIIDNRFLPCFLIVFAIALSPVSHGQEWTRFRGPNGQGISHADTIPIRWNEKDYNWKIKLPGGGHSSPVLWSDKVFITSEDRQANRGILLAISISDGNLLWQKEYTLTSYRMNEFNSYASATPVVDADHVYVLWPTQKETILMALDHQGNEIWKRDFGGVHSKHGPSISPIAYNDIIVLTHEHENNNKDAQSAWMAIDRKTGQTRWNLQRQNSPKNSYSTPCVYTPKTGSAQLIFTSQAHGMIGVDPNKGHVIWEVKSAFMERVVSSPVIAGELLIGTCGSGASGKRLIAIRPDTKDKSTGPVEIYKIDNNTVSFVPTSLAKDGLLFTFHDRGDVSCLRGATGEQLWREKPAGRFFGSPVWVNGSIYCITRDGDVVVIKAAPKYNLLAVNSLGEKSHATAAIAGGRMYLRTFSHLISIGGK